MRRTLGLIASFLLVSTLAGCGDDTAQESPPAPQSSSPTPHSSPGTAGSTARELEILHQTGGGGTVTSEATPLPDAAAAKMYARTLADGSLRESLPERVAAADLQPGEQVWAAVIAIGCDVPPGVDVEATADAVTVTPQEIEDVTPECYAPVTSVALVAGPAD